MHVRTVLGALSLTLCCAWRGEVSAAPKGASATGPSRKGARAQPKTPRSAKPLEREFRAGVPVLRSRKTPGRTKTRKGASEAEPAAPPAAAVAAGLTVMNASVMQKLLAAVPPEHVIISAKHLRSKNVWAEFTGVASGGSGLMVTDELRIHYPYAATLGRDVKLRCWHFPTKQTRLVEVVSRTKGGTETVWDGMSFHAGTQTQADGTVKKLWSKSFEVVIDTDVAPKDQADYRIDISAPGGVALFGCSLDLVDG